MRVGHRRTDADGRTGGEREGKEKEKERKRGTAAASDFESGLAGWLAAAVQRQGWEPAGRLAVRTRV